jgi:hypothetical protein
VRVLKIKFQAPNFKSLAQTDLTSALFVALTAWHERPKGINRTSRARAGSNKFQLPKFKIPNKETDAVRFHFYFGQITMVFKIDRIQL